MTPFLKSTDRSLDIDKAIVELINPNVLSVSFIIKSSISIAHSFMIELDYQWIVIFDHITL